MNCPVCNRNLAPTLSICPSCGAMMNDSVREELKDRISSAPKPVITQAKPNPPFLTPKPTPTLASAKPELPVEAAPKPPQPVLKQPVAAVKTHTTEIAAKPTSPTLVEFQNKNATLPDWRLQLQNAVRKRVENVHVAPTAAPVESKPAVVSRVLATSGANALKAEFFEEPAPARHSNPKLANALQRIEASRKRFLPEEIKDEAVPKPSDIKAAAGKNYPFYIATKNAEILPKPSDIKAAAPAPPKPTFEDLPVIEKKPLDTNKLKSLPNAAIISTNLEKASGELPALEADVKDAPMISISRVKLDDDEDILELEENGLVEEEDEAEDLAPFAMRFNSGVFDLLIGAFTSLILLAPFMLSKGNWFSLAGFLAFLVTCAIVMFVYLTTAIGMFGKSLGMKLFSLETIDIEENDYPTFHQAAVSSSVYLVSLALGGIGFLPALFNSERRTAPDLLSGTIVVKEY
jgi:uncharacterized RDD family membrane protein YckC